MTLSSARRSDILLGNIASDDCGIIAIQAVTGLKRERAEKLARKHGYGGGRSGMMRSHIHAALREAGFSLHEVDAYNESAATFAYTHEDGTYIIHITLPDSGHVMTLKEGDLHNARGFGRVPADNIYEVRRKR